MAEYLLKSASSIDKTVPTIDLPDARPFATGNGPHDYLCATCRNILLRRVDLPAPQRIAVICGKCRSANLMDHAT